MDRLFEPTADCGDRPPARDKPVPRIRMESFIALEHGPLTESDQEHKPATPFIVEGVIVELKGSEESPAHDTTAVDVHFRFIMAVLRSLMLLFVIFSMGNAEVDLVLKCPAGWSSFGLRCFKYFSPSVNWITAERNCQSLGANLASVHNKPENEFLLGLLPTASTHAWIGAHDGEQEGQWTWTDGTVYDFSNWCSGEPNGSGNENCVEINLSSNRCWNDGTCPFQMGYICVTDA